MAFEFKVHLVYTFLFVHPKPLFFLYMEDIWLKIWKIY